MSKNHIPRRFGLFVAILLPAILLSCATESPEIHPDATEIKTVIEQLFDAMRENDHNKAAAIFHDKMQLATVVNTDSGPEIRMEDPAIFLNAIAQPKTETWDEHISNLRIHSDGVLATAWMDYRFYRGETFSHCGVNTMSFLKTSGGWKITYIADTRRRTDCD